MIDPIAASLLALTAHTPTAFGLVFLGGVLSSVGPCIAPRYVAIAALAAHDRRPLVPTLAFVAGLIGAYVALGFGGGLLGTLWSSSSAIDIILAGALIAGGAYGLVRAEPHRHIGEAHGTAAATRSQPRSLGAIFLLGASSALVVSPCCTPLLAAVVATSTASGEPLLGAVLLALFGAGHALPLLFTGQIGALVTRWTPNVFRGQGPAIVSAVLMLALGMYYAVLA
ncbi:MAG: cytochrome c biogenesis protein CcdA [Candidatus Velthaea sp.]|jgi:cytochrome c biogenesis protein CcdA